MGGAGESLERLPEAPEAFFVRPADGMESGSIRADRAARLLPMGARFFTRLKSKVRRDEAIISASDSATLQGRF